MSAKSKLSNLWKGKSVPNIPTFNPTPNKLDAELQKAIESQNVKKVKSLLSKKSVIPTKLGRTGKSALHIACEIGNRDIIDLILQKTNDVNDPTLQGVTALQLAAAKGHTYVVEKLLEAHASVDQRDCNGMTALHHACYELHVHCVKVLLSRNADPHAEEKGGKTPLFYSAHRGHVEICRWLLEKGANVNHQDQANITPLMLAAKEGHTDVCELLLRRGADPDLSDREGHTSMEYAIVSGHPEVQAVFDKVAFRGNSDLGDTTPSESGSHQIEHLIPDDTSVHNTSHGTENAAHMDAECVSYTEVKSIHSIHSMDDSLLINRQPSPVIPRPGPSGVSQQAYRELRDEHDQLNEEYSSLSIENLKLRDKVESLQKKLTEKQQRENQEDDQTELKKAAKEDDETELKRVVSEDGQTFPKTVVTTDEVTKLREQVEEQKKRPVEYEVDETTYQKRPMTAVKTPSANDTVKKKVDTGDSGQQDTDVTFRKEVVDPWPESDEDDVPGHKRNQAQPSLNESQMTAMLRSQILVLQQENEQLKAAGNLANGFPESPTTNNDKDHVVAKQQQQLKSLMVEKEHLEAQINQLKLERETQQLSGAVDQEELRLQNTQMSMELESLRQDRVSLEKELEAARSEVPTDAQRLDAILAGSRNFEEVNFDEEGFVEGQDMTKEEFLQAQNQQLKTQCGLLTGELEKLKATFDAILKAGDNLQADYDQLATEKDSLQDDLEIALKEKAEVISENEFLLINNNDLHENLKKIVHELEKMQENCQAAQVENEELRRSVSVASKVGEVARLLEERDTLQQKCSDLEKISQGLQHDHNILLEEVQSLTEANNQLKGEKQQLVSELEESEQQHEALQLDFNQLELDFGELLKEKQALEQVTNNNDAGEGVGIAGVAVLQKEYSELHSRYNELKSEKQQLEEVINGFSRHNVSVENKVKELEKALAQAEAENSLSHGQVNSAASQRDARLGEELRLQQEENIGMKKQIATLSQEIQEWERRHAETVSTYRTHLLSAVQGHMDPDVKDALYNIIELRSMEQFC